MNGGTQVRWRSDGGELFYLEGATLMAVSVSTGQGVALGKPRALFESLDFYGPGSGGGYDVSADGQRFIMSAPIEAAEGESANPSIRVVQNRYEEFRDRD